MAKMRNNPVGEGAASHVVASPDVLRDLLDRMEKGARECSKLAANAITPTEQERLRGKAQGLRVAVTYVEEALRPWR